MFRDLTVTPFGPFVNIFLAQSENVIAVRLKPIILALIAAFNRGDGVPVRAITLDNKTGALNNKVANEFPHTLLRFIDNIGFTKPILNNKLNYGAFGALTVCGTGPLALPGTKAGASGECGFCLIPFSAPFAYKLCRWLIKRMSCSLNCALPFIQALTRTTSPLAVCNCAGPFPKLFAAHFAVKVNAGLRCHGYALTGYCPTVARTIFPTPFFGSGRGDGEHTAAYLACSLNLHFKRFAPTLLGAKHLVRVFLTASKALCHRIVLNTNIPLGYGWCLGSAAERDVQRFYIIHAA